MRHVRAIAVLLAMSPASAMAGNEAPKFSDEQMACLATATKEYLTTNAQFVLRTTGKGTTIMSVDDTIAQRRLVEGYCKRWAACLSSNVKDDSLRETVLRGTFAGCLENEAKSDEEGQPSEDR